MDAPAHKKQKKAHLPVADAGSAAPTCKASASGWASLTPELVGTLSKYLDLPMPPSSSKERGGISADGLGELMNLCLVVGPKTAASIRHAYLRNNETFLLYSMLLPDLDEEGEDDEEAYTKLKVKGMQNILRWMDVNQGWKSHCSDPEKFRQYQEEAGHRLMFQRDDAKEAFEFELVGGRFLRLKSIGEPLIGENHTEDQRRQANELVNYYLVRVGNSCGT